MKYKLIASAIVASATAFAADSGQLGLQLWSLRAQLTASLPQGMAEVKALGFTEVESAGTYGHTAKEFRALADANGLKIVGAHIPYERLQKEFDTVLAEVQTLGVSYVIVAWVPHDPKLPFDVSQARAAVANFNAWGAKLKAAGIGFGFHTHGYEFRPLADGTSAFDVMMNETYPDLVFCEMDVFWVVNAGLDPVKLLQKYPTRFKAFHIKDMRKGAPTGLYDGHAPASDNVIVGQGVMDWPAILAEGAKDGVTYNFIEDETADPVGNIPPSITYLETLGLKP
jgi:sugar phosphate isomerase/epimerase